jgi:uncharacterized protein
VSARPFSLPVASLMHKPGTSESVSLTIPAPTHYGEAVSKVPEGTPLEISVLLESVHEGILVSGQIETTAHADCVRCLEPTTFALVVPLQELFAYLPDEAYDYVVVQDEIDLDQVVRDQVVIELPFQPVCSEDCPGLDPETGLKRDGESDRSKTTPIDPRWAKLGDVFPDSATK